jgi:D-tyrosyl-tRNA(Tyr) deacylase
MRIVIQRVSEASVEVEKKVVGKIGRGALIFFAVHKKDEPAQTLWLAQKLLHLRMFADEEEKLNLSLMDIKGEVLVVSQFTLYGSCLEGRRPDFTESAAAAIAEPIYEQFVADVKRNLPGVQTGVFGANMKVRLVNDGPVTFIIDK